MEAFVYTFLIFGVLATLFFAVFFRDAPRIIK